MSESETRVDPHVKILDERVVARAKRRDLDALVYAPHFTRWPEIEARAERFSDEGLLVVPAREIFTGAWHSRKHVLALDLDAPIPDFLTFEGALAELERQDAVVLAPHPEFSTMSVDIIDINRNRGTIDAVEAYNAKLLSRHNRRAREIVGETGLPAFGSSYAHLVGTVGEVWTAFEGVDDEADLLSALRSGMPRRVCHRSGWNHRLRCRAELAHMGWENSWKKVDRVILSGQEATHPRHPAYEGRFDDLAVY